MRADTGSALNGELSGAWTPPYRLGLFLSRWGINALIGLTLVVATAVGGVILEDLTEPDRSVPEARWWVLLISLLCGAILFAMALKLQWRRGSVYIVEMQEQGTRRPHALQQLKLTRRHETTQVLRHTFDPGSGWMVDLRGPVDDLSHCLRDSQNADSDFTGYELVPNVIFPVGLALGYDWNPPPGAELSEINGLKDNTRLDFRLKMTALGGDRRAPLDLEPFALRFFCHLAELGGTNRIEPPSEPDPTVKSVLLLSYGTVVVASIEEEIANLGVTGWDRVLLAGAFSPQGSQLPVRVTSHPQPQIPTSSREPVVVASEHLAETSPTGNRPRPNPITVTPEQQVYAAGRDLRRTLRLYPEATVAVVARQAKVTSLIMGWYLANALDAGSSPQPESLNHPWRRLVPFWGQQCLKEEKVVHHLRPVWVHPSQDNPIEQLNRAGLDWSRSATPPTP